MEKGRGKAGIESKGSTEAGTTNAGKYVFKDLTSSTYRVDNM
jgi:hypothetical protein